MKAIKVLFGLSIILLMVSCGSKKSSKEEGFNKLLGGWDFIYYNESLIPDTTIKFTQQDTMVLGIISSKMGRNDQGEYLVYPIGSVLFKDIKRISDSSFLAKGLFIKPVFRDENGERIFDHVENVYVDYRIEVRLNSKLPDFPTVKGDVLFCTPFSEGEKFVLIKGVSSEDQKIINDEVMKSQQRIADSIRNVHK